MIFQAFVWHKLVHEKVLPSSLAVFRTISYEFDKVCMLHDAEKLNFCNPLFMTLNRKGKHEYDRWKILAAEHLLDLSIEYTAISIKRWPTQIFFNGAVPNRKSDLDL